MAKDLILTVIVKKEKELYSSWCPELDVANQRPTIEAAKKNLREAVVLHVETMIENGDKTALLDKLGISDDELKKTVIMGESFSSSMEIPLAV